MVQQTRAGLEQNIRRTRKGMETGGRKGRCGWEPGWALLAGPQRRHCRWAEAHSGLCIQQDKPRNTECKATDLHRPLMSHHNSLLRAAGQDLTANKRVWNEWQCVVGRLKGNSKDFKVGSQVWACKLTQRKIDTGMQKKITLWLTW